jgi:hypothetical protein
VFEAELLNVSGVSARVAVAGHEQLTDLHGAIQQAFNWEDDHLYSFWLDGEFWSREGEELVRGASAMPRVSERRGTAPPQYPPLDEDKAWPESRLRGYPSLRTVLAVDASWLLRCARAGSSRLT